MAERNASAASNVPADEKLDFKKILPVFAIVLIDLLGLTIIIPLMPLYATSFGASPLTIGLLGASYPVTQFIGAPLLGRLSDRHGRKPILLISQLGTFIGFVILGLANALPLLFLARIVDGSGGRHRQHHREDSHAGAWPAGCGLWAGLHRRADHCLPVAGNQQQRLPHPRLRRGGVLCALNPHDLVLA
jgi:hypothetical protein